MALTLQQAKDERDRIITQIADRQTRLLELAEYISFLEQEALFTKKKVDTINKGQMEGVRF